MEPYKDLKWPDLLVPDIGAVYQELKAGATRFCFAVCRLSGRA